MLHDKNPKIRVQSKWRITENPSRERGDLATQQMPTKSKTTRTQPKKQHQTAATSQPNKNQQASHHCKTSFQGETHHA